MRAYLEFAKKAFQKAMAYRVEVFLSFLWGIVEVLIYVCLWSTLFRTQSVVKGLTLNEVITYSVIGVTIRQFTSMDIVALVEEKIRTGEIATDLMKPIDLGAYFFSCAVGQSWFALFARALPLFSIVFLTVKIALPANGLFFLSFLLSVLLGYIVIFCINFIIAMVTFWTTESFGLNTLMGGIIAFLSGRVVPLWFFPETLERIALALPFRTVFFSPLSIYLGKVSPNEIVGVLIQQALWAAVLLIATRLIQTVAVRKVVIQGG